MRWIRLFVLVSLCSWLSLLAFPQEPSSPVGTASETLTSSEPSTQSPSQRLRALATLLKQTSEGSKDDLEALLSERDMILKSLEAIQTEALASERQTQSIQGSLTSYSLLLTDSLEREDQARATGERWKLGALIAAGGVVVELLVIGVMVLLGG